jgi:hypothetical protein
MTAWVRRAGRGVDASGVSIVWSVSEGRNGRRWREARIDGDGQLVGSLLLETAPDGRFLHSELSTAGGLLTLHPEGDGTLHGNVITRDGLRHVAGLPWSVGGLLLVEGSPIATCAAATRLRTIVRAGDTRRLPGARVSRALEVRTEDLPVARPTDDRWQLADEPLQVVTPQGLPVLTDAAEWPLEAE